MLKSTTSAITAQAYVFKHKNVYVVLNKLIYTNI